MNFHHQNVHDTFLRRDKSKVDYEKWETACFNWHNSQSPVHALWSKETRHAIRRGERDVIESAICFLEVDPFYFRSGYLKEILLHELKRAPLNGRDIARLQMVLINAMRQPPRREFSCYLHLLQKVWTPDFEAQLLYEAEKSPYEWKPRCLKRYLQSNRARLEKMSQ